MPETAPAREFDAALAEIAERVTVELDRLIPAPEGPEARVFSAMRYAALAGGKRMRPFLAAAAGRMLGADERGLLRLGCAVECIHAYSLVHDDLPCMDDDDLRRGRPTVHKAYDEATAVLAGDALQALAFEILCHPDTHPDGDVRARLALGLARAAGGEGMVGGQMIDIAVEGRPADLALVSRLQRLKTGALIAISLEGAAILAGAGPEAAASLRGYAADLGLAYQVVDDLLDYEGTAEDMGKAVRKDAARGKASFVAVLGLDGARAEARRLAAQAQGRLDGFGPRAALLRQAVDYVLERRG